MSPAQPVQILELLVSPPQANRQTAAVPVRHELQMHLRAGDAFRFREKFKTFVFEQNRREYSLWFLHKNPIHVEHLKHDKV